MHDEIADEVIARASRDRVAFAEIYDFYVVRVFAFCRSHVGSREEAEDLTALTFERALAAIARYENRDVRFSRWLLRIAANAVIDHARRTSRGPVSVPDLARIADDGHIEDWEQAYWLRGHIARLSADQQEVIRLRFYEDQRFRDVAARMGRSEGAVKQLLRRALRTLRRGLQGEFDEGSDDE